MRQLRDLVQVKEQAQLDKKLLDEEMKIRSAQASNARPIGLTILAVSLIAAVIGLGLYLKKQSAAADAREAAYQEKLGDLRSKVDLQKSKIRNSIEMKDSRYEAILNAAPGGETEKAQEALRTLRGEIVSQKSELRKLQEQFKILADKGVDGDSASEGSSNAVEPTGTKPAEAAPDEAAPDSAAVPKPADEKTEEAAEAN